MGFRSYSFDVFMQLSDGAAAYTASGKGQVGGATKILDLGGSQSRTDLGLVGAQARLDAVAVIDITAITTVTDGFYRLSVMGSNVADGSLPVELASMGVGLGTSIPNGSAAGTAVAGTGSTTTVGRFELPFTTHQNGVEYEFIYLYVTSTGATSHSITLAAFVAMLMEE